MIWNSFGKSLMAKFQNMHLKVPITARLIKPEMNLEIYLQPISPLLTGLEL